VAAAALASLLTGAVVLQHARGTAEADLAVERAASSLGVVSLRAVAERPAPQPSARAPGGAPPAVTATVVLVNRGEQALGVQVLGLDRPGQVTARAPEAVVVEPGSSADAALRLELDCSRLAPPEVSRGAADAEWVRAGLAVDGRQREVRLPVPPAAGDVDGAVAWACRSQLRGTAGSVLPTALPDGRMTFTVTAPRSRAMVVDLRHTPGLGVTSDAALPRRLEPGQGTTITLALSPDCSRIGHGQGASADLVAGAGREGGNVSGVALYDTTTTAAWVAHQVALTCG